MFHLVVQSDFGRYRVGDRITDPAEVENIRANKANLVVAVKAPAEPKKPAAKADQEAAIKK